MTDILLEAPQPSGRARGWRDLLRTALGFGRTRVGIGILLVVAAAVLVGPLVAPHSETGFVGPPYSGPSHGSLAGTDNLGRDVLSRFLDGGRTVLLLALAATLIGVASGTLLGLLAAYSLRVADEVLMRAMDLILAFPAVVLVLMFIAIAGPAQWLLALTVGVSHTPQVARVVRAAAVQVGEADFVRYAEALGVPRLRILLTEILPNIVAPLTVEFGLRLTYSIGLVAGLAYLGFGLRPPAADWGLMIQENQPGITVAPWAVLLPVLAIALLTVGSNLVTDGLGRAVAGVGRRVEG